ncbi:MAG: hypothetical protein QM784_16215 [Polyangiaceae bacterium]
MTFLRTLTLLVLLGWLPTGCKNLDRFDTRKGESFCGGLSAASDGFEYWTAQTSELKVALTLDTGKLDSIPGKLRSNDADFGPCKPHALFEDAPIRVVRKALGDRIAEIRLGDDHEEEVIAFVDSTCSGSMVAILSLVQDGSAELRLLRPAPEIETPVTDQPRFGVFGLEKVSNDGSCDF